MKNKTKLRIIKKNDYFYPQTLRKSGYGNANWCGFSSGYNTRNVRFSSQKDAVDFVNIVSKAVEIVKRTPQTKVVYSI